MIEKEMGQLSEQIDKEKSLTTLLQDRIDDDTPTDYLGSILESGSYLPSVGPAYGIASSIYESTKDD